MANGEGFALVYSIISNLSFTEIEKIRNGIAKHKNSEKVPMVLVGNKKDLGMFRS
jgi:GTPase SAR1 family protein